MQPKEPKAEKKTAKKATPKKTVAKKTSGKQATEEKVVENETIVTTPATPKKTTAKKAAAKKVETPETNKVEVEVPTAKKTAKKTTTKKKVEEKPAEEKVAKKVVAKKATAKKTAEKKEEEVVPAAKKTTAKKTTAKKKVEEKPVVKPVVEEKPVEEKVAKKVVAKKAAAKKTTEKKEEEVVPAVKKTTRSKTAAKKKVEEPAVVEPVVEEKPAEVKVEEKEVATKDVKRKTKAKKTKEETPVEEVASEEKTTKKKKTAKKATVKEEAVAEPTVETEKVEEKAEVKTEAAGAPKKNKKNSFVKKFLLIFWGLFFAGIISIVALFWMTTKGWIGYLPPLDELQNPKSMLASEIFTADHKQIGRYYRYNRVSVHYTDISPFLLDALIATEDARYFGHSGIDFKSLARAVAKMGKAGGGSTITQQLAKQLWSPRASNVFERAMQKPIEWVIATKLERLYSKEEILTMYLNQFDFLYNAVGIKSAAHVYFNTTPDQLSMEESAMLVGMCKNPSLYNPMRRPEQALNRRNVVFDQMCKYNYIDAQTCDSLKALPVKLDYQPVDHKQGIAPYFREYIRRLMTAKEPKKSNYPEWNKQQYELDKRQWEENPLYGWCNKNFKHDGTPYNLYQDGLRIYTTIDSHMQKYAEESVNEHMQYLQRRFFREKRRKSYAPFSRKLSKRDREAIMTRTMRQTDRYRALKREGLDEEQILKVFNTPVKMSVFSYKGDIDTVMTPMDSIKWTKYFLRCGFVSMDPKNGAVKAYVGGPNFEHFQYDMVNTGRRQVGSTIKPFLYSLAMNEGFWPCDSVLHDEITLLDSKGKPWTPRDGHTKNKGEMVTINWGLSQSSNWVTAYMMSLFSPHQMVRIMRKFGISGNIPAVVSLCLGPCEVSVQEMANAYTAFANKGVRIDPMYVTRIEDINGNTIATFSPKKHEVLSELTTYKMLYMLRNVMSSGTGARARSRYGLKGQMGGKTGTSQNHSDGWFIGFTPSLVTSVWVGGEDRSIHFDNMAIGQGASTALPIWAIYMQKVYADDELCYDKRERFDVPRWFNPNQGCR